MQLQYIAIKIAMIITMSSIIKIFIVMSSIIAIIFAVGSSIENIIYTGSSIAITFFFSKIIYYTYTGLLLVLLMEGQVYHVSPSLLLNPRVVP